LPHTWGNGMLEYWNIEKTRGKILVHQLRFQDESYHYPNIPFPQNPWPRPFTHRFRFTMAKFENAVNNILNQLSRTRAGQYSTIPSFHYSNWGGAPKF